MIRMGYIRAEYTYKCIWCERTEVVIDDNGQIDASNIDSWILDPMRCILNICSADCKTEQVEAQNQAFSELPVSSPDMMPEGFDDLVEKKRIEKMQERSKKWM